MCTSSTFKHKVRHDAKHTHWRFRYCPCGRCRQKPEQNHSQRHALIGAEQTSGKTKNIGFGESFFQRIFLMVVIQAGWASRRERERDSMAHSFCELQFSTHALGSRVLHSFGFSHSSRKEWQEVPLGMFSFCYVDICSAWQHLRNTDSQEKGFHPIDPCHSTASPLCITAGIQVFHSLTVT